jgi:hypothetical protein
MSEGPPKPALKIEGKEGTERPPRYRTIDREILETREDGTRVERVLECNGLQHRRCVDEVSYAADGEITFANQLSREELGPCDGKHA